MATAAGRKAGTTAKETEASSETPVPHPLCPPPSSPSGTHTSSRTVGERRPVHGECEHKDAPGREGGTNRRGEGKRKKPDIEFPFSCAKRSRGRNPPTETVVLERSNSGRHARLVVVLDPTNIDPFRAGIREILDVRKVPHRVSSRHRSRISRLPPIRELGATLSISPNKTRQSARPIRHRAALGQKARGRRRGEGSGGEAVPVPVEVPVSDLTH